LFSIPLKNQVSDAFTEGSAARLIHAREQGRGRPRLERSDSETQWAQAVPTPFSNQPWDPLAGAFEATVECVRRTK